MIDPDAPVSSLKNLGPSSERWLGELGVRTVGDLVAYGPLEAYQAMKRLRPREVSLNALYAMVGGLMGLHWTQLPPELKEELRASAQPR